MNVGNDFTPWYRPTSKYYSIIVRYCTVVPSSLKLAKALLCIMRIYRHHGICFYWEQLPHMYP